MRTFTVLTKPDDEEAVLCPIGEISEGYVRILSRTKDDCLKCVWHSSLDEGTFRGQPKVTVDCAAPTCSFCKKEIALCKTPEQTNQMEPVMIETAGGFHQSVGDINVYWWHCGQDHCEKDFVYLLHKLIVGAVKEVIDKGNVGFRQLEKELKEKFKERNKELTKKNSELKKELRKKYSQQYKERITNIKEKYTLAPKKKVKPATSLMSFVES